MTLPHPVTSAPTVSSNGAVAYVTTGSTTDDKDGAIYALEVGNQGALPAGPAPPRRPHTRSTPLPPAPGKTKWTAEAKDPDKGTVHTARMKVALAPVTDAGGNIHEVRCPSPAACRPPPAVVSDTRAPQMPVVAFGGVVALLNPDNGTVLSYHSAVRAALRQHRCQSHTPTHLPSPSPPQDNTKFASPASVFRREAQKMNMVYARSSEDDVWFFEIDDGGVSEQAWRGVPGPVT